MQLRRGEYRGAGGYAAAGPRADRGPAGQRVAATWGRGGDGPAGRHVFLLGFPRSGATLLEQALAGHGDVTALAETECLIDAARDWLADAGDIARFCAAPDEALDPYRAAYWRRVAAAGVDPAGRVFVDKHGFNIFKLPLIARLFPEARIIVMRRDPRDTVLSLLRQPLPDERSGRPDADARRRRRSLCGDDGSWPRRPNGRSPCSSSRAGSRR